MKKTFTLFLTAMFAVSMSATTFTFTSNNDTTQTKDGITVKLAKGTGTSAPAWVSNSSQFRVYANNTITITGDSLGSAALTCAKTTKTYAALTADCGTLKSGGTSTGSTDKVTDQWTGNAVKSVKFTVGGSGQRIVIKIVVNEAGGAGGDTTMVEDVDALDIAFYPSYSKAGAYDYTFDLYNSSEDDGYIPELALDILTQAEKSYAGTYSKKDGTLTEYSYYVYGDGDEDYFYLEDGEITITDNGDESYTIKGWFTDGEEMYGVDVTLEGYYYNAEYAYEPEEKSTLNLNVTDGEIDNSYAEDYYVIDIYLTTDEGDVQLEYVLKDGDATDVIPDGTYPIEATEYDEDGYAVEKNYNYFDAGYFYSAYGMPYASYYATEEAYYYLVGGNVKIETVEAGTKVTLAGTTYYGSTINAEYTIVGTALNEAAAVGKVEGKFMQNGQLYIQKSGRIYNIQGQAVK